MHPAAQSLVQVGTVVKRVQVKVVMLNRPPESLYEDKVFPLLRLQARDNRARPQLRRRSSVTSRINRWKIRMSGGLPLMILVPS